MWVILTPFNICVNKRNHASTSTHTACPAQTQAQNEARHLTDSPWGQTPQPTSLCIVKDASDAIQFCKQAFEANGLVGIEPPRGNVGHAELRIGTSSVMLAEEFPDMDAKDPLSIDSPTVGLHFFVKDVNAAAQKAIQARSENPVSSLSD